MAIHLTPKSFVSSLNALFATNDKCGMVYHMSLSKSQIMEKVVSSADKYGNENPQQYEQLRFVLAKCPKENLFEGLYAVFLLEDENNFERQQLAGRLLFSLKPRLQLNLFDIIRNCLGTYNLSVEELPWYFSELCGKERVIKVVDQLAQESLSEAEAQGLRTFQFWLRAYNG